MSKLPTLIDNLVTLFGSINGAEVVDGPQVTDSDAADWILVGFDGDASGDYRTASTQQQWVGLSTRRAEQIDLTVALVATRGDTDVRAARQRVYEMNDEVEALLQANPSAGMAAAQVAILTTSFHQEQTANGIQARLLLSIYCEST
jgi:hypothetical protein